MKKLLTFCLLCIATFGVAQDSALFDQGKANYKAEQYVQAIQNWKKVLDNGNHSAALYFNLANAHYKLNEVGPSIFYYEKALQLAPNDNEIKTNLAFAENARVDAIEPLPKSIFSKWYNSVAGLFHYDGWALLSVIFSSTFVLIFLIYYFVSQESKKRLFFTLSLLCVVFCLTAFSMAYMTYTDVQKDQPAIVFAEATEIKVEPKLNSNTAFTLHAGTKVQILETDGDWLRISIANGKDGWIPISDLKKL